jgi:hypothetical protein
MLVELSLVKERGGDVVRTIEFDHRIDAPPDDVFRALTDFSRLTQWRRLESLRLEPEGPLRIGTRLYKTVKGPGQRMRFVNEVTVLDLQRREYDDRWIEGTFPIESGWRVEQDGNGARFRWTTRFAGRGPMRLLSPLLGSIIRRGQKRDLRTFAALLK